MKLEEVPFEINAQTMRYLSELVDFCNNFPTDGEKDSYIIETYNTKEKPSYRSEENNANFWEYLKKAKIIFYEKPKTFVGVEYEDISDVSLMYPKTLTIKVLEPDILQQLASASERSNTDSSKSMVRFEDGVLSYGSTLYKFQSRNSKGNIVLEVFKEIWSHRKILVSGQITKQGKILKPRLLATKIDVTLDHSLGRHNDLPIRDMLKLLKEAETNIRRKKIPLRITRKNGVQIVLDYKKK